MLYLALVQKKGFLGKPAIQLLASQKSEKNWAVLSEEKVIECPQASSFSEGLLVLADIHPNRPIVIREATDWVVDLVKKYLTEDATSTFWLEERERAEQWRQSLTLQSQDLARRTIEIEALRENNQALADELKSEKKEVDRMTQKLVERLDQQERERQKQAQAIASSYIQEIKRRTTEEIEALKKRNQLLEEDIENLRLKNQQLENQGVNWEHEKDPLDPFRT